MMMLRFDFSHFTDFIYPNRMNSQANKSAYMGRLWVIKWVYLDGVLRVVFNLGA